MVTDPIMREEKIVEGCLISKNAAGIPGIDSIQTSIAITLIIGTI
jgi:hypothetical protein